MNIIYVVFFKIRVTFIISASQQFDLQVLGGISETMELFGDVWFSERWGYKLGSLAAVGFLGDFGDVPT